MRQFALLFLILSVALFSCDSPKNYILAPNTATHIGFTDTLVFKNKYKRSIELYDSIAIYEDSLVYYKIGFAKHYINCALVNLNNTNEAFEEPYYFLVMFRMPETSSQKDAKIWYIDWNDADTDTLYADYYRDPNGPNECSCFDPLRELRYNGQAYVDDTEFTSNGVYIFDIK